MSEEDLEPVSVDDFDGAGFFLCDFFAGIGAFLVLLTTGVFGVLLSVSEPSSDEASLTRDFLIITDRFFIVLGSATVLEAAESDEVFRLAIFLGTSAAESVLGSDEICLFRVFFVAFVSPDVTEALATFSLVVPTFIYRRM